MSWQAEGQCFEKPDQAVLAIGSAQVGKVWPLGSALVVVDLEYHDESTVVYRLTNPDGVGFTLKSHLSLQECTLLDTGDGLMVAWLIVAAWAGAFAFKLMRRSVELN